MYMYIYIYILLIHTHVYIYIHVCLHICIHEYVLTCILFNWAGSQYTHAWWNIDASQGIGLVCSFIFSCNSCLSFGRLDINPYQNVRMGEQIVCWIIYSGDFLCKHATPIQSCYCYSIARDNSEYTSFTLALFISPPPPLLKGLHL